MSLVEQRKDWKASFSEGYSPRDMEFCPILQEYEDNRDSEGFRCSFQVEVLCEYILYLEEKLNEKT